MVDDPSSKYHELEEDYKSIYHLASKFCDEVKKQIGELLEQNQITLAFPIESRVKSWQSIDRKMEEKLLTIDLIKDIDDLIGIRIIPLFLRDLLKVCNLLDKNFNVINIEDTQSCLKEYEFGYLSIHYLIELPDSWFKITTFTNLKGFKAEVQVRTAAQHIWAAASHDLQYKQESAVPIPVRRSIHRVSALLEMVDLELERVLNDRAEYIKKVDLTEQSEILNVDILELILKSILPKQNYKEKEELHYSDLLDELVRFGIDTPTKLKEFLKKHLNSMLRLDSERVKRESEKKDSPYKERIERGVFYTHIGLVRTALGQEFEDEYNKYKINKYKEKETSKKRRPTLRKIKK